MTGLYAIIDMQRMGVLYKHAHDDVLTDLAYIELPTDYEYELIGLSYGRELDFLSDRDVVKLGASLGVMPLLLETDSKNVTLKALHDLHCTKVSKIEASLQADWILQNATDIDVRYRYTPDSLTPEFAPYDWLPPLMVCAHYSEPSHSGRKPFRKSIKYQIFLYMNNIYLHVGQPADPKSLAAVCRDGTRALVKQRGYNRNTVSQAITDWKKELIHNDYAIRNY